MTRWLLMGDPDWAPLRSFEAGLRLIGVDRVEWRNHRESEWSGVDCDAVAIYGLRAQGRDALLHYQARGIPVIVIDHGYMNRVHTYEDFGHGYFQVGVGRLGWTPPAAPADRFESLGIEIQRRAPRPIRRVLIMGQVPHDASHRKTPLQLTECYESLAEEALRMGARSVAYRAHPSPQSAPVQPRIPHDGPQPLASAIAQADLVVSLNSNAGIDAIIAGCPACTLLPSHYDALAYRWPVRLAAATPPPADLITAHLHKLAYAQWTQAEMAEGLPQRFLASIGAIP